MRNLDDRGPRRALSYPAECLAGCSGSVHVMGSILLILALIGAGYLYISYKEKRVASDMPKILAAYEGILDDYIKDPEDRAKLKQALGIIAGPANRYISIFSMARCRILLYPEKQAPARVPCSI